MMKWHLFIGLAALAVTAVAPADDKAKPDTPAAEDSESAGGPKMSADILGFYGTVTGTVESVDSNEITMKVKVSKAEPDAAKNKAPKPEAMPGQTITITPLAKKTDGKSVLDEKASGYIKGAKTGDPVTLAVRASREGVVFRLLKVPSAGSK